jgi:D-threo-aldose 1-dehydrogenase
MVAKRDQIAAVCARHGVDLRAAALQFCAAHPVVAAIIPGAKYAAKVRENAELMKQPIPAALWDELRRESLLPDAAPTPAT